MTASWQLFVDTGGTFTDAIGISPHGCIARAKVLSNGTLRGRLSQRLGMKTYQAAVGWHSTADVLRGGVLRLLDAPESTVEVASFDPQTNLLELVTALARDPQPGAVFDIHTGEEAPILAARLLTGTAAGEPLPLLTMRLGTTLATNALLTRTGARTVLFVTRGFRDLLTIGTQQRPDLFALQVVKPPILPAALVEVDARMTADGQILQDLDTSLLQSEVARLLADGFQSAAVALLHADRYPDHEQALATYLNRAGFANVSCSSDMAQAIRILPRAMTATVDAYLAPIVQDYLARSARSLDRGRLLVMTSAGGLIGASRAKGKDLLLSGPAGGVVGAARAAALAGFDRVLSFDMGGTSSDVARFDGRFDYVFEHRVGDAHLFAPALAIETVAAGGGSICRCEHGQLAVGPASAGAFPGPACYGARGPLTLTDVNLLLGRLDPERFGIPIDVTSARTALQEVLAALQDQSRQAAATPAILEGFLQIANERMADAMRRISIRRGYDPGEYVLVAFGGAGGQHACAVADLLGVKTIIIPEDAGMLSAWGTAGAVVERFASRQVLAPLDACLERIPEILAELAREARVELGREGVLPAEVVIRRRIAELRFAGQESTLQVELQSGQTLAAAFASRYRAIYGHQPEKRPVELVSLRVVASSPTTPLPGPSRPAAVHEPHLAHRRRAWFSGGWRMVMAFARDDLSPGNRLSGPALVLDCHSATVVEPGWQLLVDGSRAFILQRSPIPSAGAAAFRADASSPEAVQVELYAARLESIAREMGAALERAAVSVNVKERHDFSCAVLDTGGELVVNAPHIPVHLGSLGLCVRALRTALPLSPGDVAVTNHPACGGSHLPDLTVVAPVHAAGTLIGYVAARAHHAEIGGLLPGSMAPQARNLAEEGVVIPPTYLVREGRACFAEIIDLLRNSPYPTRALADNIADLEAAVAACHQGAQSLTNLVAEHGRETLTRYLDALKDRADHRLRQALAALPDGDYVASEHLDDGTPLCVRFTVAGQTATVDFTGSATVHPGNLNATPAIVHSVVIYVLRLMVREALPLNEGLLRPVRIVIPTGILDPPFPADPARAPSIVGGNVETSQRLVDLLLKALQLCAASQGTMNNVLFGNANFSYYETVCGGCGAGPAWDGASAVHSHMTNTRITDPELLELRYPVRLEQFAVRYGSGGRGRQHGGDGVIRSYLFLVPLELSLLSQRRHTGPYGLAGGGSGTPGKQTLVKAGGDRIDLGAIAACTVAAGDRLVLATPGGGGYGFCEAAEMVRAGEET